MFTGIVEEVGTVVDVQRAGPDARLVLRAAVVLDGTVPGASIAVDGVCLTVTEIAGGTIAVDIMPETIKRSTLGDLSRGDRVNLERAVPVTGRLDGHLVQGHVDGVGQILARTPGPRWDDVAVSVPTDLARYIAEKGSIAVAGVSLTVTFAEADRFGISLIPTTLAATTLGGLGVGAQVNLEVDVIAKYVERLLAGHS